MTDTYAMTPKQALEVIEATGAEDPARLIADHAAAGLVRSYAQVQQTIEAGGERNVVRGARVQPAVWERMIAEGVWRQAWTGGTVRMVRSDLIGGAPAVHVTGFAFHPADVERLANQQHPTPQGAAKHTKVAAQVQTEISEGELVTVTPPPQKPQPSAIPPGALLATVKQAEAALGFGRTKINGLMNDGTLVRVKKGHAVRIEVASIRAFANQRG